MQKIRFKREKINEDLLFEAVSEGITLNADNNYGKPIPVIIVDFKENKEIYDSVIQQIDSPRGCVISTWATNKDLSTIYLILNFTYPIEFNFSISLTSDKYIAVIDILMDTQLFLLQPGKIGERVSQTIENKKLLLEVPRSDFRLVVENIMKNKFHKNHKEEKWSKKEERKHFDEFRNEWKKIFDIKRN